uniref:Reverse transcriptase (RNA-dependent DNA polymerase) n=1 Tax=Candidatus Kentrum sp. SD TaxID=2126332 RepID=A0A451BN58_9GAMM|nr:MAG: hypothetical protein BECKSD772D_GA0070982_106114 [Candidatus Kentron sp. SD]
MLRVPNHARSQPQLSKVHSLTGRITSELMRKAFKNVKRNRGAAEIDKVSIQMFEANLDEDLDALMRDLKTRSKFQPKPLRRALIPKGRGKMRPLGGISVARDRIALRNVATASVACLFEPLFQRDSFGGFPRYYFPCAIVTRPCPWKEPQTFGNKGTRQSRMPRLVRQYLAFGSMAELFSVVADGNILGLVERFPEAENGGKR